VAEGEKQPWYLRNLRMFPPGLGVLGDLGGFAGASWADWRKADCGWRVASGQRLNRRTDFVILK